MSLVVVEPGTSLGEVVSIHVAPARRIPTRSVESVVAEAGAGLVGDRYHGSRHRHVTIQSAHDLDAAGAALGSAVDPGATRRSLTVSGAPVPGKPGTHVRVGEVLLEVVRPAAPCRLLDDWIGPGAMKALHGRGGSVFRILQGGTLRVGDPVLVVARPDEPGSSGAGGPGAGTVVAPTGDPAAGERS